MGNGPVFDPTDDGRGLDKAANEWLLGHRQKKGMKTDSLGPKSPVFHFEEIRTGYFGYSIRREAIADSLLGYKIGY
jgi:hypothetical protein